MAVPGNLAEGDTTEYELQNTTETGNAPRRRIATPAAAYQIYDSLKEHDEQDAQRRAIIQGMVDGNPPYNQRELDEAGLGHLVNVNFMSMRANLDSRAGAAHELFMEVATLIELTPRAVTPLDTVIYDFANIIAEEFTTTVMDWPGFLVSMDLAFRESDAYGLGYCIWPNEWDWRPKAYKRGSMLVDSKASVDVNENELIMLRDSMKAGELYTIIENEEAARAAGWSVANVKKLLVSVYRKKETQGNQQDPYQRSDWESWQQMIRNNDPWVQEKQFEDVRIVNIYVEEYSDDRRITHQIIPDDQSHDYFLYEKLGRYESIDQAVWWMPYNYGDGYIRSVRGVGSWMAQHDDLSNRFLCRVFDTGFLTSSLLMQPGQQGDSSRLEVAQFGPITILPNELNAIQASFTPQLQPLIQLRDVSESIMKNNTGMYRQHPEVFGDGGQQKTARQVVEEVAKEARLEKAGIAHRYSLLERLYIQMLRKMVAFKPNDEMTENVGGAKEALAFRKRCMERGVPADMLNKVIDKFYVRATRAIGLGSLGVEFDITNQLMNASGSFDEQGKKQVLRDWLAPRVGQRNVDKYAAKINRDTIPSNEHSIATLENNDITQGQQVSVGSDQTHSIHLQVLFQGVLGPIAQAVEAGQVQDPMKAYQAVAAGLPHGAQHLQYLQQDSRNKELAKGYADALKQVEKAAKSLERDVIAIQKQQQQQAEQQAQQQAQAEEVMRNRETDAKMFEIQKKFELEMLKQESLNAARAEKTDEQMNIKRRQVASSTALSAEKQQADIDIERAKAQAEIEIKRQRAGQ